MLFPITEHVTKSPRHTTAYLACGPSEGPLIVFCHGWPELAISWRHQLPTFAALGFRCIAPDMRGYGRSTVHPRHKDYAQEEIVADMLELLDSLEGSAAVWVGHDWGSPVVWNLASHHPERCLGVSSLCIPYIKEGFTLANLVPLVDREIYPVEEFPAGQWDYQFFYQENFDKARAAFEANVYNTVKLLFRKGDPTGAGKPAGTAAIRKAGDWFGGGPAPDLPPDTDVVGEQDLSAFAASLERNGFFGADSWYMNHERNGEYALRSVNGGRLDLPVLYLHGAYDWVCETVRSRLAEPMRADCSNLTEVVVHSGHWMAQEQPVAVNAALARWLATALPELWTARGAPAA
jgi:pimeloyl-ACP methyl ester carboxylesterase